MLELHEDGELFKNNDLHVFFGNKKFSNTIDTLNSKNLIFGRQLHEDQLLKIDDLKTLGSSTLINSSDGLKTTTPYQNLSIYTADCVPCFVHTDDTLYSLHLGWRSLQKGLLDKALPSKSSNTTIFIGPHIGEDSFEVGADVVGAFKKVLLEPSNLWSVQVSDSKHLISLRKIIELKALKSGSKVITSSFDTLTSNSHHSYRRENKTKLRNISFAFLKK